MANKQDAADGGAQQVQDQLDTETEQGFAGDKVDPRPNEDYTVAGAIDRQGENLGQAGEPAPIEGDDQNGDNADQGQNQ